MGREVDLVAQPAAAVYVSITKDAQKIFNFLPSFKQVIVYRQNFYAPQFFWCTFSHDYLMQVAWTLEDFQNVTDQAESMTNNAASFGN